MHEYRTARSGGGPEPFDESHNSCGALVVLRFKPNGETFQVDSITADQVAALAKSTTGNKVGRVA